MEARASAGRDPRLDLAHVLQMLALQTLGRTAEAEQAYARAGRLRPVIRREDVVRSHGQHAADQIQHLRP